MGVGIGNGTGLEWEARWVDMGGDVSLDGVRWEMGWNQ